MKLATRLRPAAEFNTRSSDNVGRRRCGRRMSDRVTASAHLPRDLVRARESGQGRNLGDRCRRACRNQLGLWSRTSRSARAAAGKARAPVSLFQAATMSTSPQPNSSLSKCRVPARLTFAKSTRHEVRPQASDMGFAVLAHAGLGTRCVLFTVGAVE